MSRRERRQLGIGIAVGWGVLAFAGLMLAGCASPTLETGAPMVPPVKYLAIAVDRTVNAERLEDCNAYAEMKRRLLAEFGVSARLAAAYTERGEGHMVTLLDIKGATWVLDNRYPEPMPLWRLPYTWIGVEDPATLTWSAAK